MDNQYPVCPDCGQRHPEINEDEKKANSLAWEFLSQLSRLEDSHYAVNILLHTVISGLKPNSARIKLASVAAIANGLLDEPEEKAGPVDLTGMLPRGNA